MDTQPANRRTVLASVCTVALLMLLFSGYTTASAANTSYYVNCSSASNGNGSISSPWNTLNAVNNTTFGPGDAILLKRGTTCNGSIWPQGSGSNGSPITLGAYDSGARPIISAGTNQYAIKLYNQEYWKIENIETTGGTRYGILVSGEAPGTMNFFRITNVAVHDVNGGTLDSKITGLIVFKAGVTSRFNDVVIDGATVYNTNMWSGIVVSGNDDYPANTTNTSLRSTNITIRNSTAYDVYGDGIVIFVVVNGLLENNVAYRTGLQPTQTIGTPNAIWQWTCKDCVVQYNEAYENKSPGIDGGAFDIDYHSDNNIVQYNYGHDNQTYCVAVFGAANYVTTNSIIRYNVCANNGDQELEISTWNGGGIDGVQIYNNTFYTQHGVFNDNLGTTAFVGTRPRFFKNNLIYSTNANPLGYNVSAISRDYNLYYYNGGSYTSGEPNSKHVNPLLNNPTYPAIGKPTSALTLQPGSPAINAGTNVCTGIAGCSMGSRDFYGNIIPQGGAYDIGAYEGPGVEAVNGGNLLTNAGFESGTISPWGFWPPSNSAVVANNAHSGTYATRTTGSDAGLYRLLSGLSPNTTYTFRGWIKAGTSGNSAYIYAKNFGGSEVLSSPVTSTNYTQVNITFTTGASSTTAEIGLWRNTSAGSGDVFADDFELVQ